MKKILFGFIALCSVLFADNIDYPAAFDNTDDGDVIFFDVHVGGPFDTVANVVNGRLDNTNIKTGANILPTKLDSSKTLFMRVVDADTVKNVRSVATADLTASGTSGLDTVTGAIATFTSHVTVDTMKVTKGISATIGNFSAGVNGTTGTFSSTVTVDSLKSTKGISATNANLSAGLIATTGTFSSTVTVDTLKSTKGINATNFTGNHIGSVNGGTTGTFSGTVTVDSLKSTKGINVTNGVFSSVVGIGRSDSLLRALSVHGGEQAVIALQNDTTGKALLAGGYIGQLRRTLYVANLSDGPLKLQTKNLDRLVIDSTGNVGIGITAPTTKLAVSTTFKSQSVTTDTIKSCKIITSDSANITKLSIANVSTGAGTFTGTVTVDSLKSTKGVNATNGTFSSRVSVDSLYSAKGIRGTNGTFSAQVTVDSLKSTKGVSATIGNFSAGVNGTTGTFSGVVNVDSLKSTKGINATNFTGNLIGSVGGGTTGTFSGTVEVDSLKSTKSVNAPRFMGYANSQNSTGVANGYLALNSLSSGIGNTANGYQSLYSITTANNNTATGYRSLYSNVGGSNSAYGYESMLSNTSGLQNVAVGVSSLTSNTDGLYNTAVGYNSASSNVGGDANTSIGFQAMYSNTSGSNNSTCGYSTLPANTTGSNNVALGLGAGGVNKTGSNNTWVGYSTTSSDTNFTNSTALGASCVISSSNTLYLQLTQVQNFADSAAAYAGGIRSGGVYRVGSSLRIMW